MDISTLVPLLSNAGIAGVVILLIIFRLLVPGWMYAEKKAQVEELQEALRVERQRGDAAVAAASATRDILLSLKGRGFDERSPLG